ncbi:toll/interleukin-1 receptor domain-containing protein [Streptomyces maremycinicus]|uniref:toll/interleukin-1 receptor domain-containing protein n=1 Tax=Streptomyces maremycinicus TaxID=1679753 RepID=UPI000787DFD3|nr:toll/interleukin-1 receptor domain-containing protein [Streptomyces sp. NBRC 110468]
MAPNIFINFRRADTDCVGPQLDSALRNEFGAEAVFRDQRSLLHGLDYRKQLERAVRKCDLLLAVMGSRWASVQDNAGRRYIDDANDWVRKEIALALAYETPVIPVLIDNARLPDTSELPSELQALTHHQACYFRPHQEHIDLPPLIAAIRRTIPDLRHARSNRESEGTGADGATTFNIDRISGGSHIYGGSRNTINNHGSAARTPASVPEDDDQGRP